VVEALRPHLLKPDEAVSLATYVFNFAATFSSPLPHPTSLQGYEALVPGSADRFLKMAESEQRHRHRMEWFPYAGLLTGFVTMAVCLGLAAYFAIHGNNWAAAIFVSPSVVAAVRWFIQRTAHSPRPAG
jgi:uncharacterized membrane protein